MPDRNDEPNDDGRSRVRRSRWVWAWLVLIGLLLIACSRFAAATSRWIDVIAIYSWLAMWPALLLAAIAGVRRRACVAVCAAIVAVLAAMPVAPSLFWFARDASESSHAAQILVCNVQNDRDAIANLAQTIQRETPDVIVVIEMHEANADLLLGVDAIADQYPHTSVPGDGLNWPVVILSRWTLEPLRFDGDHERYAQLYAWRRSFKVRRPASLESPESAASSEPSTEAFLLTAIHAPSPRTDQTWVAGHDAVRLLGEVVRDALRPLDLPIVIAGDFNTAPGGFRYRLMADQTGLRPDDAAGPPVGTWPSTWPGLLRVSLDQVWASPDVRFNERRVLEHVGSDHRPLLVEVVPWDP